MHSTGLSPKWAVCHNMMNIELYNA